MRKSLTREERLKRKSDFDSVFAVGKRKSCSGARLVYRKNGLDISRFAVCPVRKYGTAVERNRAKRICRELFRTMKTQIASGYDIVLVIYPGKDTFEERGEMFSFLLERSGLSIPPSK
jgi:ribonuclease P protein component